MFSLPDLIQIKNKWIHPQAVIGSLWGQLTLSRQQRILDVISHRDFSVSVVAENIYDHGNLSAVMRSAEALGFADFHIIETGERFKESQRTTAGADKWLEVSKWKSSADCLKKLKDQEVRIYATSLAPQAQTIESVDFSKPCALVFGNEKSGISDTVKDLADACVILPIRGFTQSYNISVAAAMSLYHVYSHKKAQPLSESQLAVLKAHYILRTLDSGIDQMSELIAKGAISAEGFVKS
jgi:tRNA (guanosine-2'-O-)-methyltransferase